MAMTLMVRMLPPDVAAVLHQAVDDLARYRGDRFEQFDCVRTTMARLTRVDAFYVAEFVGEDSVHYHHQYDEDTFDLPGSMPVVGTCRISTSEWGLLAPCATTIVDQVVRLAVTVGVGAMLIALSCLVVQDGSMTVPTESAPESELDVPVTTEWAHGAVVLSVSGAVDYLTYPQLKATIQGALAQCPTLAVIDLLRVDFFGSAGLTLLVEAKRAAAPGTEVRVVASGSAVLRPWQMSGLDGAVHIYPTVSDALASPSV
jgi:anti-anti-sigma factor